MDIGQIIQDLLEDTEELKREIPGSHRVNVIVANTQKLSRAFLSSSNKTDDSDRPATADNPRRSDDNDRPKYKPERPAATDGRVTKEGAKGQ